MIWISGWGFSWVVGLGGKPKSGCRCLEVLPPAISLCILQTFIYHQGKGWEAAVGNWKADVSLREDSPCTFKGLWRGGGPSGHFAEVEQDGLMPLTGFYVRG